MNGKLYEVDTTRLLAALWDHERKMPGRYAESEWIRDRRAEAKAEAEASGRRPFYWYRPGGERKDNVTPMRKAK